MKFLGEGVGTTADAIKAIAYTERMATGIYRAVVLGFNLQQVADPGARRFLLERNLDFFGLGRRDRILLVDDDGGRAPGTARAADVAPFYEAALLSLGQAYERVEVPGPGPLPLPNLDPQRYPAVIWFTGRSTGSLEMPNLTWNDQYNLDLYLHTRVAAEETERIDLRGTRGSIFGEAVSYRLTPAFGTGAVPTAWSRRALPPARPSCTRPTRDGSTATPVAPPWPHPT